MEAPDDGEIIQSSEMMDLAGQLQIISLVKDYINEFVLHEYHVDSDWNKGYSLPNEIMVSRSVESVYKCKMEVFFQEPMNGQKKLSFLIDLIRFEDEPWRVFQIKESD